MTIKNVATDLAKLNSVRVTTTKGTKATIFRHKQYPSDKVAATFKQESS